VSRPRPERRRCETPSPPRRCVAAALVCAPFACSPRLPPRVAATSGEPPLPPTLSFLLEPAQATAEHLRTLAAEGADEFVIAFPSEGRSPAFDVAVAMVESSGCALAIWLEVGRNPALAAHAPDAVATLQGHAEWRRRFPGLPPSAADDFFRCDPWVSIRSVEGVRAQREWWDSRLVDVPSASRWYVNDLQGPPSACGCGNLQCRWTAAYGSRGGLEESPPEAARDFLEALAARLAGFAAARGDAAPEVVPVLTLECELADGAHEGRCAGVACFDGRCWKEFWPQFAPVNHRFPSLGLLLLARTFERVRTPDEAAPAWIAASLETLCEASDRRAGPPVAPGRVFAVVEAFGRGACVSEELLAARRAGVRGVIVAEARIEQGFVPRLDARR
jgi:hypothetical protein